MSDPTPKPRWPRRVPPHLAALHDLHTTLPLLATMTHIQRYLAVSQLLVDLPQELRLIRDEAVKAALTEGMTYRELADAVGCSERSINRRVTDHNARNGGRP